MKVELGNTGLEYDLAVFPYHPADMMLSEIHHENKMEKIRQMDINGWVEEQIE
jgi:hypothetical protein